MTLHKKVGERFDKEAIGFDGIYTGKKSAVGRIWDNLTRKNIHERFDFTLEAIGPLEGKRIFDAGCGSGRHCIEYARRRASKVVGVDLAPAMLDIARRVVQEENIADRCEFILKDIMEYKPDEPFDVVTSMGFFDYIPDPVSVLTHLRRMLSEPGTLVASFPALWAFRAPFRKLWRMKDSCFIRFYTQGQIREYCNSAGLIVDDLIRQGPNHLLVGKRGQE